MSEFCILAAIILPANEMRRITSNGFVVRIVGDAPTERQLIFGDHTYLFSHDEHQVPTAVAQRFIRHSYVKAAMTDVHPELQGRAH